MVYLNTQDLEDIVEEYKAHALPLDVFVLDMDWHTKDEWRLHGTPICSRIPTTP